MSAIDKIYSNDFGISFYWKKETKISSPKVQLIFRDIGFLLSLEELKDFAISCHTTITSTCCRNCNNYEHCRSLLLRTPSSKIDLAVNQKEAYQIQELINETIFRVTLKDWVKNLCFN